MTSIPGESNGRKSAPKSTAVFVAPNTETEGLPGEREHPLVIPNQRSVHRNDEDYRRDVCDDDVGGSDDVNDKAATMPGRKTTREDRGHPRDIAQSGARCVFVVQARLYKCKGGQANT